ncbi:MAG: hypothetical protein J6R86_01215 [Lentisphaeria bacterium]|nr:hypothetical protein [Lentisphaeria bacterium]
MTEKAECGGPSCALTSKRAGKLVNVSSRRPALFSSSSHDHPADCINPPDGMISLAVAHIVALLAQHASGSFLIFPQIVLETPPLWYI